MIYLDEIKNFLLRNGGFIYIKIGTGLANIN